LLHQELNWKDAEKDILDDIWRIGLAGRSGVAVLVGSWDNDSVAISLLVARLQE
jgi:hypothetical protein